MAEHHTINDVLPKDRLLKILETGELGDDYDTLFDFYSGEMPYGTAKARTGDPVQWIFDRLEQEFGAD